MIQLKNIVKEFDDEQGGSALDGVTIQIREGEIVSVVGPSGCGKTTLLKIVAGLIAPTSGEMSILERKPSIVFQNPVLLPWKNVSNNVRLPLEISGSHDHGSVKGNIKLVGLEGYENFFPYQLSGGMQQRVAIARALVNNSSLLLMDEPFGSLDEINRNNLNLELLRIHRELKSSILFVTHSISEAVFLSDKVIIMSDGPSKVKEVVEVDLPRERDISIKETEEFQRIVRCIREKLG